MNWILKLRNIKKPIRYWAALALKLSLLVLLCTSALADDADTYIKDSQILIGKADPGKFDEFFAETTPKLSDDPKAPLARYNPVSDSIPRGVVEFGNDLHRYKSEYTYATVPIPKPQRPTFDQYMTVLMALSLANEKAHFQQHQNRSLADFFVYRKDGNVAKACALYGLQQHASDVTMLNMAIKLNAYFKETGSQFGMNAVTSALDRMSLLDIYKDFYDAAERKDRSGMTQVLRRLKAGRDYINLSGIPVCRDTVGEAMLPDAVIARAIAPAYPYLLTYGSEKIAKRSGYND